MKKRLIHILLFLVLIISSIGVSFASFSQLANEKDFTSSGVKDDVSSYICYNKNTQAKYTNLNTALSQASNGQSIFVVPGSTVNVYSNIVISSGVSLYIPYEGENWDITNNSQITNSTFCDTNAGNVSANRKTQIILNNGADITIESGGKLYLGGIFGSRGINSYYCEITLGDNSSISCYGEFYCYGYVKEGIALNSGINSNQNDNANYYENECDENRFLRLYSGSYIKTAVAIHDAGSTGQMSSYYSAKVCPLNIIEFPNIQTFTRVDYGSSYNVQLRMALGSGSDMNYTNEETSIINTNSSNSTLFKLNSGWIGIEYCPDNTSYTTYSGTINSSPTRIFLHGDTSLGELEFSVKIVISITIKTSEMFLPISHKFIIYICNGAVFNADNDIKFMPGSFLQINEGGTFNSNADMMIYSSSKFSEVDSSTYPSSCRTKDAIFNVNGTFNASDASTIGGFVTNSITHGNAIINLSQSQQDNLRVTLPEGVNGIKLSSNLTGPFYDDNIGNVSNYQFKGLSTVYSYANSENLNCWIGDKYSIFNLNIIVNNKYTNNFVEYRVYQADDSSGANQIELTSSVFNGSYNFEITNDKYFKIVVSGNEESVYFSDLPDGTNYEFKSDTWYLITGNTEITIIPGEGLILQVYVQGISGAGSSSVRVDTSKDNSSFTNFTTYSPSGNDVLLKNIWIKLSFTGGINSSFKPMELKAAYRKTITSPITCSTTEPVSGQDGFTSIRLSNSFRLTESTLIYISIQPGPPCLVSGSKIMMADGTSKAVENLKVGDEVKVFNHMTGKVDTSFIAVNVHENQERVKTNVINLVFSNGVKTRISFEHGFFDKVLNEYVYINELNYKEMVGRKFAYISNDKVETAILDNAYITYEEIYVFSPVTYKNLNIISDGLLSIGGDIRGLFNYFELDENMKVIEEKMLADIETYGLFTYEEWAEYLTPIEFEAFNVKYLKVSIGKGLVTMEELLRYINSYLR